MRRLFCFSISLLIAVLASAQTQQGVVKTRGRMVNGKHVAGKGLQGATVAIRGRSKVLSEGNGTFSFPVPSKTFSIDSVRKKGYQLVDADATKKPYQYSTNTLYIVMQTPEQQMEDLLEAEEKISNTLRQNLKKARQEIQRLKDEKKISEEEYAQRINQLVQDQQNSQKLIADMAKEYAQIDYDQLDDLNRRISDAILNGRLLEADSLLRSKGDMRTRNAEITRRQETEAQRKKEIEQEQQDLADSEAGTRKLIEDFAADCYKFFDRFKMDNQHDSAAYYIQMRAELDTTNAKWQIDAAYYYYKQNQFRQSEMYYVRALQLYHQLATTNPQAYEPDVAQTLNNLAILYSYTHRFAESEKMFLETLEKRRRLAVIKPQTYDLDVANTLNNLGRLYSDTQRFAESEKMYQEALENYRRLAAANPQAYESYLALTLNNLALLYSYTKLFEESETMYKEALEIRRRLATANPQIYELEVAQTLNDLANLYKQTQRFAESEKMYQTALEIRRRLAAANPQAYEPGVAETLHNLANLYSDTQRFAESEKMYHEALEIRRRLADTNPQAYEPDVAGTCYILGLLKKDMEQYAEAILYFQEALEIYRRIAQASPAQQQWYNKTLYWLSQLYATTKKYTGAYQINLEWLPILKKMYEDNKDELSSYYAGSLGSQSFYAIFMKKYAEAEQYAREGLAVDSTQHFIYSNLAAALLFQGKYAEAEKIYRQYKDELKDGFLDDFKQFAEAGVIPKEREADVERIKKILSE